MAPIRMPEAVIGLDVGKSSHWACVATRDGEVLLSAPVANREDDLDSLFGRFPDALVVVDQSRNIGALALARARAAGMSAAYLPGLAAHGAARLFAGDAKTDERDAMVIAKTALGIPDALLPVGDPGPTIAAARALAAQRNFLTCENTRNKNRLRSILLESCPAFEALVDLSDGPQLRLMASLGGAWSVADAGPRRAAALTRGAARGKIEALVRSTTSSTRPDASVVAAEDRAVKLLAHRISENSAEIEAITAEISALLEGDDTYRCLLTVPGIGPKTASELAISIDIEDFPSHDRLASFVERHPAEEGRYLEVDHEPFVGQSRGLEPLLHVLKVKPDEVLKRHPEAGIRPAYEVALPLQRLAFGVEAALLLVYDFACPVLNAHLRHPFTCVSVFCC